MPAAFVARAAAIDFSIVEIQIVRSVANAASLMAVQFAWLSTTVTCTGVANLTNNTGAYTLLQNPTTAAGMGRAAQGYKLNNAALSTTIDVNFSGTTSAEVIYYEATGLATSSAEDPVGAVAGNVQTSGTSRVTSALVTTVAGDLVLAACFSLDVTAAPTAVTAPYTAALGDTIGLGAYLVQGAAGSTTATFTGADNSDDTISLIMGFKVPGGASSIKVVDGLAIASVKTVNGLAIASVKVIDGLTNV